MARGATLFATSTRAVASPSTLAAPRPRRRPRSTAPRLPSVSVVIPAKDEAENLPLLFEKLAEQFSGRMRGEVILVDDGSVDGTYEIARAGAAQYRWLRVRRHSINRGLTAALKTGFDSKLPLIIWEIMEKRGFPMG